MWIDGICFNANLRLHRCHFFGLGLIIQGDICDILGFLLMLTLFYFGAKYS